MLELPASASYLFFVSLLPVCLLTVATPFVVTWKWATGRESKDVEEKPHILPLAIEEEHQEKTDADEVSEEIEYRIYTMQVPRSAITKGYDLHARHFIPMGEDITGWELVSVSPFENESNDKTVTLLALIGRTVDDLGRPIQCPRSVRIAGHRLYKRSDPKLF
jgi:hypothetical protein